ncbi:MAG: cupin domain-containing protein [Rhodospirillales bacterium]|nr:cupin domain-containing protein [Alphaproteobacteria bacterium]MBL6947651.1 cupin domain-containing protein [Rhodospirillales bacterium]
MMATENFFNIDDPSQGISRQLAEGITTRVFPGEQAMLSLVRCDANSAGSIHSHPEEQWGMCLEGSGVRNQDGIDVPFKKGDFWCTPGGVKHGIRVGPDGAIVLDIFAPPRAEYRKAGSGFGG